MGSGVACQFMLIKQFLWPVYAPQMPYLIPSDQMAKGRVSESAPIALSIFLMVVIVGQSSKKFCIVASSR